MLLQHAHQKVLKFQKIRHLMNREILIDSCVYISLLREGKDPAQEITRNVNIVDLCICGMIRMEVIRGIRCAKIRKRLEDFMDVMKNVPTNHQIWLEASELAWQLSREGINLPNQDILIAVHAKRANAAILTHDKHFSMIPSITLFNTIDEI